ncbi:MAG: LCP family protein [Patescibacteria group bacterium]|nr:LCP family protein [Patescibacteria group bacterium]
MQEEVEIIKIKKIDYSRAIFTILVIFLIGTVIFFGARAYTMTKKIVTARSESASPYLSGGDTDISKLSQGDRRINILLMGIGGDNYPGGNLTDTISVVSIDPKNDEVAMISVPRDLYIKVPGYGSHKINSIFSLQDPKDVSASGGEKKSAIDGNMALVKKTVGDFLGVPIHYAAVINFDGFKKIIDTLGGVDINVTKEIYDPYFPDKYAIGYDPFYIETGLHHLDGETALKYARSRETSSDFDRSRRQQEVIVAAKEKAVKSFNPSKIAQIMNILSDNLRTDMQVGEMEELFSIAKDIKPDKIKTKVLDDSADGFLYADKYDEMYVLVPQDSTLGEIHDFVSQYFKDPLLAAEHPKILVTNSTKNSYWAGQTVEDLKSFGYDAMVNKNDVKSPTDNKPYEKTFIYDYSNGRNKYTIDFLAKHLGSVPVITLDEKDKGYDIEIILGNDFKVKN